MFLLTLKSCNESSSFAWSNLPSFPEFLSHFPFLLSSLFLISSYILSCVMFLGKTKSFPLWCQHSPHHLFSFFEPLVMSPLSSSFLPLSIFPSLSHTVDLFSFAPSLLISLLAVGSDSKVLHLIRIDSHVEMHFWLSRCPLILFIQLLIHLLIRHGHCLSLSLNKSCRLILPAFRLPSHH